MKLFSSLDVKDRRMLLIVFGLAVVFLVVLAVFTPGEDPNDSPVPDSYLAGHHGAKAAFTLLQQSGYVIDRWEQPLSALAAQAGPGTVLILAEPFSYEAEDRGSVATILRKGGRVLATGLRGGMLLPHSQVAGSREISFAACNALPDGLQPLASGGPIWIVPSAAWEETDANVRTAYICGSQPVVVEYSVGTGHAVWWASSTPLENSSIVRGGNLELLLNSVGPPQAAGQTQHLYWDESLHGQARSPWDYTTGPVWRFLWIGSVCLALLVVVSYSRRSGPVRELPEPPRATPVEFLDALGGLYHSTGAASTALQIACDRFRTEAARMTGQRNSKLEALALAAAIQSRFGSIADGMEPDLVAVEEACWDDHLKPRDALELIQILRSHEETLRSASRSAVVRTSSNSGVTLAS